MKKILGMMTAVVLCLDIYALKIEDFSDKELKGQFMPDDNPINGFVLSQSGILDFLRFYGPINFQQLPAIPADSGCNCSYKDTSHHPMIQLLIWLYPSSGPSLNPMSDGGVYAEHKEDIVNLIARMFKIANYVRTNKRKFKRLWELQELDETVTKVSKSAPGKWKNINKYLNGQMETWENDKTFGDWKKASQSNGTERTKLVKQFFGQTLELGEESNKDIKKKNNKKITNLWELISNIVGAVISETDVNEAENDEFLFNHFKTLVTFEVCDELGTDQSRLVFDKDSLREILRSLPKFFLPASSKVAREASSTTVVSEPGNRTTASNPLSEFINLLKSKNIQVNSRILSKLIEFLEAKNSAEIFEKLSELTGLLEANKKSNEGKDNKGKGNEVKDNKGKSNEVKDNKGKGNEVKDNKGKDNKGKGNEGKDNKGKGNEATSEMLLKLTEFLESKSKLDNFPHLFTNYMISAFTFNVLDKKQAEDLAKKLKEESSSSEGDNKSEEKLKKESSSSEKTEQSLEEYVLNEFSMKNETYPFKPGSNASLAVHTPLSSYKGNSVRGSVSNCVEVAMRHFFSVLFYTTGNEAEISTRFPITPSKQYDMPGRDTGREYNSIKDFFEKYDQIVNNKEKRKVIDNKKIRSIISDNSTKTAQAWDTIVGEYEGVRYLRHTDGNERNCWNVDTGWQNFIKLICRIMNGYSAGIEPSEDLDKEHDVWQRKKNAEETINGINEGTLKIQCKKDVEKYLNAILGIRTDTKLISEFADEDRKHMEEIVETSKDIFGRIFIHPEGKNEEEVKVEIIQMMGHARLYAPTIASDNEMLNRPHDPGLSWIKQLYNNRNAALTGRADGKIDLSKLPSTNPIIRIVDNSRTSNTKKTYVPTVLNNVPYPLLYLSRFMKANDDEDYVYPPNSSDKINDYFKQIIIDLTKTKTYSGLENKGIARMIMKKSRYEGDTTKQVLPLQWQIGASDFAVILGHLVMHFKLSLNNFKEMVYKLSDFIRTEKSIDSDILESLKKEFWKNSIVKKKTNDRANEVSTTERRFTSRNYFVPRLLFTQDAVQNAENESVNPKSARDAENAKNDKQQPANAKASAEPKSVRGAENAKNDKQQPANAEASAKPESARDAEFVRYLNESEEKFDEKKEKFWEAVQILFDFYNDRPNLCQPFDLSVFTAGMPYIKDANEQIESRYIDDRKKAAKNMFKLFCLFDQHLLDSELKEPELNNYWDLFDEIMRCSNNVTQYLSGFSEIKRGKKLESLLTSKDKLDKILTYLCVHKIHSSNFTKEYLKNLFRCIRIDKNADVLSILKEKYTPQGPEQEFSVNDYLVQSLILQNHKEANIKLATYLQGDYSAEKEEKLFEIVDILWEIYSTYPEYYRFLGAKALKASAPIIKDINQRLERNWKTEEDTLTKDNMQLAEKLIKYLCLFKAAGTSSSGASASVRFEENGEILNELKRFSKNVEEKLGGYPLLNKEENENYLNGEKVKPFIKFNEGIMKMLHPMIVFDQDTENKVADYYQEEKLIYPFSRFGNLFDVLGEDFWQPGERQAAEFQKIANCVLEHIGWSPEMGITIDLIDRLGFPKDGPELSIDKLLQKYLYKLKAILDKYNKKLSKSVAEELKDRITQARNKEKPLNDKGGDNWNYSTGGWSAIETLKELTENPKEIEWPKF